MVHTADPKSLTIVLLMGGIVAFLVALGLIGIMGNRRRRQWEHAERLKALEMGLPVPARDSAGVTSD